jgi:mono/diheme cytochrome c family protein
MTKRWIFPEIILPVLVGFLLVFNALPASAGSPQPTATPDRLAPPPTVFPPTQASLGAQVYYQVCMACHGDRGQGLTEEWRNILPPPDNNCWTATCHGPRHPIDGFALPKYVPAVVGKGVLSNFGNAANLHDFISQKMPWQAPGSLKPEEYWQLTAYLLQANGIDPGPGQLDDGRAAKIRLSLLSAQPPVTPATNSAGFWIAASILLFSIAIGSFIVFLAKNRS